MPTLKPLNESNCAISNSNRKLAAGTNDFYIQLKHIMSNYASPETLRTHMKHAMKVSSLVWITRDNRPYVRMASFCNASNSSSMASFQESVSCPKDNI